MTHLHERPLTPTERIEIAEAFGWRDVSGVGDHLLGTRPLYSRDGGHYAWLVECGVPAYNYDTLRYIRLKNAKVH